MSVNRAVVGTAWRATCMAAVAVNEDDNVRIVILYLFSARPAKQADAGISTFK